MTGATPGLAGAADIGTICPYCRFPLKSGVAMATCSECGATHHGECWSDNGGCAITGCAAGPGNVRAKRTAVLASSEAAGVAQPPLAVADGRPPSGGAPRVRRVLLIAAVVAIGSAAALGYLLTREPSGGDASGAFASTSPATPAAATTDVSPTVGSPTAQTATTTTTTVTPADRVGGADKVAMVRLLRRYEFAYSARDTEGLRLLFTRGVSRHGFQRGGCGDSTGRKSVVEAYAAQFALGTGRYTLTGVSASAIRTSGSRPTIDARYAIAGGNAGRLTVQFSNSNGRWLISRLNSHCRR